MKMGGKLLYRIYARDLARLDGLVKSYDICLIHPKLDWLGRIALRLPTTFLRVLMLTFILYVSEKIVGEDKLLVEVEI
jgi:hypothetical protein